MCILYSSLVSNAAWKTISWVNSNPMILFFHAVQLLVYPLFLVFLWKAIGGTISHFIKGWSELPARLTAIIETAIGLGIFSFLLFLAGFFGQYNIASLICILVLLTAASFIGWKKIYSEIFGKRIVFENSGIFSVRSLSAELAFLLFWFVASVSLISVLRPMPIGWDDLGVYMNFPKMMANTGNLLEGAGMYTWHLITGTGFLFGNTAAQAFYVNQIGGFLATIAIISAISLLTERKNFHKNGELFVCLPMILGIVYYLMPMTIFQQAKDMKLDPALMFVSVTGVMALIYAIKKYSAQKKFSKILIFIAGLIVGIAFGIKFTTLMLIISSLGFISYKFLGYGGFIGFFWLFIAAFTGAKLWSQIFVWMPENTLPIALLGIILAIIGFSISYKKFQNKFRDYIIFLGIFILGIGSATLPWIIKNFTEIVHGPITISGLLNGKSSENNTKWAGSFYTDWSKIYSAEELVALRAKDEWAMITSSGTSLNEDFSRYFGQEKGLSNYIKLPTNLTFQINQKGEFTDITYIFLAFTPVALLFGRRKWGKKYQFWILGITTFLLVSLITFWNIFDKFLIIELNNSPSDFSKTFTAFFESIPLPWAYLVLILLIALFLALVEYTLSDDDCENNLKGILYFTALYGLIFWVSGFGVVWYGVLIYFFMLAVIGISLSDINYFEKNSNEETFTIQKYILLFLTFGLGIYWFVSATNHSFRNFISAEYDIYKYGAVPQDTSIFLYKSDYFKTLVELNVNNPENIANETIQEIEKSKVKNIAVKLKSLNKTDLYTIQGVLQGNLMQLHQINASLQASGNMQNTSKITENNALITDTENILDNLYKKILYPSVQNRNNTGIYRIGTFMSYFIQNNRARFFEDSLINQFQSMFYDVDSNITIDRVKKIGLGYFLIDLNAATIDKDARHALTTRYENLLLTLRNPRLTLIDTDNICLRLAVDEYHAGKLTNDRDFLNVAGTNYTSYADGSAQPTTQKKINCMNYILANKSYEKYDYIGGASADGASNEELKKYIASLIPPQSFFALFKIRE